MLTADGVPLARQYVCPKDGKVLSDDEIVRGFETAKDEFVVVTDDELEALAPRRSRDIELARFVERSQLDPAYFVRSYFLVPAGEQTKAYRLLASVMEQRERAAIGSFVMREKAYAVAVFADAGVLRAETLRFAEELRSADALGLPKPTAADRARARKLEKALASLERAKLDPDELRDDADARLLALAREKRERGEDVVESPEAAAATEEPEDGEVIDLMALLRDRMRGRTGETKPKPRRRSGKSGASASRRPRRARRG
jgi:DNA end-binding protein Ku